MRLPGNVVLAGIAGVALTIDLYCTRRFTEGAGRSSTFTVDMPAGNTALFACDGPVVGTWVVTGASIESQVSPPPRCPGRRIDSLTASGTLTFDAAGTFADTTLFTVNGTSFIPTSSRRATCSQLETEIAGYQGIRAVSCKNDFAGACACAEVFDPPSRRPRWTGKYSVQARSLGGAYRCTERNVMRLRATIEGNAVVMTAVKIES